MKYDIPYMTTEAVSLLKSLISIPSISREETQAADFLQNYIEMAGMQTGRKGNNVWCFSPMFDLKKPTILLNSHIDTVKPVNGWRKDPFTPREENGKLYGLGSNDAGASVVSLLQVFLQLCRTSQKYNLIYLASCEEEVSGKDGIESVLQGLPPVAFAIVGEPTEMQPAIAEKGLMVLDVTATGKAGHAARNEGDNAIYKVLDDIAWFRDYRFEKESPLLGPVKMSVTVINAGTQHNVIPDKCTFIVDVRSNELYTNEELFAEIKKHISCEAQARSFRLNSSRIDEKHPFVQKAMKLGTRSFWFSNIVRPSLNVLPIGKNWSGPFVTFTHGRRIYHAERDRRSYRTLFRVIGRASDLIKVIGELIVVILLYSSQLSIHPYNKNKATIIQTTSIKLPPVFHPLNFCL